MTLFFRIFQVALFGLFLIMTACEARLEKGRNMGVFNLDSLLDIQVDHLSGINAELNKYTLIGDSSHLLVLEHDSSGWAKELSIFRTADIHKPGVRAFYRKKVSEINEFKVEEYISTDSSKAETLFLKIYFDNRTGNLNEIEALQFIRNPIYRTRRELKLIFRARNDEAVLDSIYVKGFQKMITLDSVIYYTAGKIRYE